MNRNSRIITHCSPYVTEGLRGRHRALYRRVILLGQKQRGRVIDAFRLQQMKVDRELFLIELWNRWIFMALHPSSFHWKMCYFFIFPSHRSCPNADSSHCRRFLWCFWKHFGISLESRSVLQNLKLAETYSPKAVQHFQNDSFERPPPSTRCPNKKSDFSEFTAMTLLHPVTVCQTESGHWSTLKALHLGRSLGHSSPLINFVPSNWN